VQKSDLQAVKQALVAAGVEIYRTRQEEIQVAERVRLHIMDSGIRVKFGDDAEVVFTARSQQSDFPNTPAEELFAKVRNHVGAAAIERGFVEREARTSVVSDPVDAEKVLDVWHEVIYAKPVSSITEAIGEVQWALALDKYVSR
jgi:hypothetical protein